MVICGSCDYECDIASYADNVLLNISINLVLEKLESSAHDLFPCFKENHIKANRDKYHLLVTTNALTSVNINGFQITNCTLKKLLGIAFDSKLSFKNHAFSLCKKASQKLQELTRIINYMNLSKQKALMKTFVTSQFNYCPLVWMFIVEN